MAEYLNLDFLNANTLREYPIKEGVSRVSTDGLFTIPDDLIADLVLCASSDSSAKFYISSITTLADKVVILISSSNILVGTFTVTYSDYALYNQYSLVASTNYVGANGKLCIGKLDTLQTLPLGTFNFTVNTAELEPRVCIPGLQGINRITFVNQSGSSFTVSGNVQIQADNNVRFVYSGGTVLLEAADGLGLNVDCETTNPILTINGLSPDVSGNFTISTKDCASLTPLSSAGMSGLIWADNCCKPCLGCDEVSTLTQRLTEIETDLISLHQHYTQLSALIDTFQALTNPATVSC